MTNEHPRMARERKTVQAMIHIYCQAHHATKRELCSDCQVLCDYAMVRLDKCPYQEGKTTCTKCPVHCYQVEMREKIRVVMRYAGPRMIWRHPIMAVWHINDGRREEPIRSPKKRENSP